MVYRIFVSDYGYFSGFNKETGVAEFVYGWDGSLVYESEPLEIARTNLRALGFVDTFLPKAIDARD